LFIVPRKANGPRGSRTVRWLTQYYKRPSRGPPALPLSSRFTALIQPLRVGAPPPQASRTAPHRRRTDARGRGAA
jgi:hypothetical protein